MELTSASAIRLRKLLIQSVHLKSFLGPQEEVIRTQGCLELQFSRRCPKGGGGGGEMEFGTDQRVSNKTEKTINPISAFEKFSWAPGRGNPNTEMFRTSIVQALPEKGRGGMEFGTDQRVISETQILTWRVAEVQSNINE